MFTKPYHSIPIRECGEPLVAIPPATLALMDPHPYASLGAPYGKNQPWMLRKSILASLIEAQDHLQKLKKGWKILLFDAFRPNTVQTFMVEKEFEKLAEAQDLNPYDLSAEERLLLEPQVYRLWAVPSDDPKTPPPHSTGAAFDCTLVDEKGQEVDMGSPIDENSDRSLPDYYASQTDEESKRFHENRFLLNNILQAEGFSRDPKEWWHFSRGDQIAVWVQEKKVPEAFAIYGRVTQ